MDLRRIIEMAIPVYLFLKDEGGSVIKSSVDIAGRENSIEVLGLHHLIIFPTNDSSGRAKILSN